MDSTEFVERYCNMLGFSNKPALVNVCKHVVSQINDIGIGGARQGQSVVAAAIYFVCQLSNGAATKDDINHVTGVSIATIREVYMDILNNKDKLLPQGFVPTVPLETLTDFR